MGTIFGTVLNRGPALLCSLQRAWCVLCSNRRKKGREERERERKQMFWGSSSSHDVGTELQNSKCHVVGGELSVCLCICSYVTTQTFRAAHREQKRICDSLFVGFPPPPPQGTRISLPSSISENAQVASPPTPLRGAMGEH